MGWIQVSEQGHLASSETNSDSGEKKAKQVWIAIADEPMTTVQAETASAGGNSVPASLAGHPDDATRRVVSKVATPDPESMRTVFSIEVSFSNKGSDEEEEEDPLDRDPEISWDFNDYTETYFEDRTPADDDGPKKVLNTAQQKFDEFLERDTGSIYCTITKNIPATSYDPAVAVAYKDAVNEDSFELDGVTIDAGQCKMKSYTAGPRKTENGVAFRVAKWVLEFRETWDDLVENLGYQELVPGGGSDPAKWKYILGEDSKRVDSPYPLDINGAALEDPSVTDDWLTLTFVPYFKEEYAAFEPLWEYA